MPGPSLAAALASAVLVAASGGTIVPQRGIAGVTLGMKPAQVRATLGQPVRQKRGSNDFGSYLEYTYPGRRVTFQGLRSATAIRTTRRDDRTRSGAGPGSTEAALRRAVPGLTCKTEFGFRHCYLGRFRPGRRVTDFSIRRRRVTSVLIGFVLD